MIFWKLASVLCCLSLTLAANSGLTQVIVTDAWVRGTVPGQRATGAFMQMSSATDQTLVAASSPVAQFVEIHEMTMERGVMKMRPLDKLDVRTGQTVNLKAGGHHLMLLELHAPVKAGDSVPIALTWQDKSGKTTTQNVTAVVKPLTSGGEHKH